MLIHQHELCAVKDRSLGGITLLRRESEPIDRQMIDLPLVAGQKGPVTLIGAKRAGVLGENLGCVPIRIDRETDEPQIVTRRQLPL